MSWETIFFGWFQYGMGAALTAWMVHDQPEKWPRHVALGIVLMVAGLILKFVLREESDDG